MDPRRAPWQGFTSSGLRPVDVHQHLAVADARLQEARRIAGRPLSVEDGMIAAIAAAHGATLATRNPKDFEDLGIDLVDPWEPADA